MTAHTLLELGEGYKILTHKLDFDRIPEVAHTANVVLAKITELTTKWGITPVEVKENVKIPVFATTDSGTNITKAIEDSKGHFVHIPCFAHKMHRVMISAIAQVPSLERTVQKVVAISRNMAMSDKQKGAYVRFCRLRLGKVALIPVSPVRTRWYSYGDAITRYIELHSDLRQYVLTVMGDAAAQGAEVIVSNLLTDREVS